MIPKFITKHRKIQSVWAFLVDVHTGQLGNNTPTDARSNVQPTAYRSGGCTCISGTAYADACKIALPVQVWKFRNGRKETVIESAGDSAESSGI